MKGYTIDRNKYFPFEIHNDLKDPIYIRWSVFLDEAKNWSKDQIENYQLENFKNLLRTAYEQTRGYKRIYDAHGFDPYQFKDLRHTIDIPVVDKNLMKKDIDDFTISGTKNMYITTGGSTGIPFGFYRTHEAFMKELASKAHQYRRYGWKEGDTQVILRGVKIENDQKLEFVKKFNELRLSSYHLTLEHVENFLIEISKYSPDWIKAYPSSLTIFANILKANNLQFPSFKGILLASENVYEHQIQLFQI